MAATLTDIGGGTNNINPSVTCTFNTTAATSAGDKVIAALLIPNDGPTAITVTFDGNAMTQDGTAARAGSFVVYLYRYDDAAGRASGKAVTASWTNTGTQHGGGSLLVGAKSNSLVSGAPDATNGTGSNFNNSPTTGASGSVGSASANYVAFALLGNGNNTAGATTPANSYTAFTEQILTARIIALELAAKEFTAPVAAQTETWTTTWGASKNWAALICMYKETGGGVVFKSRLGLMGAG